MREVPLLQMDRRLPSMICSSPKRNSLNKFHSWRHKLRLPSPNLRACWKTSLWQKKWNRKYSIPIRVSRSISLSRNIKWINTKKQRKHFKKSRRSTKIALILPNKILRHSLIRKQNSSRNLKKPGQISMRNLKSSKNNPGPRTNLNRSSMTWRSASICSTRKFQIETKRNKNSKYSFSLSFFSNSFILYTQEKEKIMDKEIYQDYELTEHKLGKKNRLMEDIEMIEDAKLAAERIKNLTEQGINYLEGEVKEDKKLASEGRSTLEELRRNRDIL